MDTSDNLTIPTKHCPKCQRDLPATYVYFTRRVSREDGLYPCCKECQGRSFTEQKPPVKDGHKRCTKCKCELPATIEYFHKSPKAKDGWYPHCKKCRNPRSEYGVHSTYVVTEGDFKYCTRCGGKYPATLEYFGKDRYNPNGLKRNCRNCIQTYMNRYYDQHSEKLSEVARKWHAANPEVGRTSSNLRRARVRSLPATFTVEHERKALEFFNHRCAVCERQFNDLFGERTLAMDHWIPLSKGGGTTPQNMIPMCHGKGGCNSRKRDSDPIEWLKRRFKPQQVKKILERIEAYFSSIKE